MGSGIGFSERRELFHSGQKVAGENALFDRGEADLTDPQAWQVATRSGSMTGKSALYFDWFEMNGILALGQRVTGRRFTAHTVGMLL